MSIVVYEHAGDTEPYGVMTGDTLFIGDVGRPDLLGSIGFTKEELADKLYDSLHNKLMPLPDATWSTWRTARLGMRQEPLDRVVVDDGRAAQDQLRAARTGQGPPVAPVTEGQPPAPAISSTTRSSTAGPRTAR